MPKLKWNHFKFWKMPVYQQKLKDIEGVPHPSLRFQCLDLVPFDKVRVMMVFKEPFGEPGYTHGYGLSMPANIPKSKWPRHIHTLFRELYSDIGHPTPRTADLRPWAKQGVLLYNLSPTIGKNNKSHLGLGWEKLALEIVTRLSKHRDRIVLVLVGPHAQFLSRWIDHDKHLVLSITAPVKFHADGSNWFTKDLEPFLGSSLFSRINEYLDPPIDWSLPC